MEIFVCKLTGDFMSGINLLQRRDITVKEPQAAKDVPVIAMEAIKTNVNNKVCRIIRFNKLCLFCSVSISKDIKQLLLRLIELLNRVQQLDRKSKQSSLIT